MGLVVEHNEPSGRTVAVFVYGTLKPGAVYYPRVALWVVYTTEAAVPGELFDTGFGYPVAKFGENDLVMGTVLHIAEAVIDQALAVMDQIEDEGKEYRRVRVVTTDGTEAISYEWMGDTSRFRPLAGPWYAP